MKIIYLATAAALFAGPSLAFSPAPDYEPTAMFGVSFAFGGGTSGIGFTAKILSSNETDTVVGAGGVTFYPWAETQFGFDLGLGFISDSSAATLTYDFMQRSPQFSFGYADGYTVPAP